MHLMTIKKNYLYGLSIYFYKSVENEVDFLIMYKNTITSLINVSYISNERDISTRELRSLDKASTNLNCKNLIFISYDLNSETIYNKNKIKIILILDFLLMNITSFNKFINIQ